MEKETNNNYNTVLHFLNLLEGYKTRIKNLHWSAEGLNIHKQLDKLLSVVSDYQDSLAEDYMGGTKKLEHNTLVGITVKYNIPLVCLENLLEETNSFYSNLPNDEIFIGIKSETENFIHNLYKFVYLFKLC